MYRVVVYSNNAVGAALVHAALRSLPAQITTVEAEQRLEQEWISHGFDLLVMLSTKPLLSGRGLIGEICAERSLRPIIYVVSWQQSEASVVAALDCGIDQYFTFPLNLLRFRAKVERALLYRPL